MFSLSELQTRFESFHIFMVTKLGSYRRNTSDSLSKGIFMVLDKSVEMRVKEPDGDTECKRQRLDMFGSSA